MTADVDDLPPTQYLLMEVLAARFRTGERFWTFPTRLRWHALALADAGLVDVMSSPAPRTFRAKLTDKGLAAAVDLTYSPPVPTLAQAIDTLPATNTEHLEWMREHGLGPGAGIGTVISHIRAELRKLAGGDF